MKMISQTSSLNRMPVTGSMTREPKIRFTVEEMVTTIPLASTIEVWLYTKYEESRPEKKTVRGLHTVPWSSGTSKIGW